jgi:hypothetical protein
LMILLGAPVLAYLLVCLFLAGYLWFNPIVFLGGRDEGFREGSLAGGFRIPGTDHRR